MTLVLGVCSDQGQSLRLEVLLPCWELCFVRREEAEGPGGLSAPGLGSQGTRYVRGAAGALSREAGSREWPFLFPGAAGPGGPAQLYSPHVNQRESWGQSVPLLNLDSFSPKSNSGGE